MKVENMNRETEDRKSWQKILYKPAIWQKTEREGLILSKSGADL